MKYNSYFEFITITVWLDVLSDSDGITIEHTYPAYELLSLSKQEQSSLLDNLVQEAEIEYHSFGIIASIVTVKTSDNYVPVIPTQSFDKRLSNLYSENFND